MISTTTVIPFRKIIASVKRKFQRRLFKAEINDLIVL